MRRVELLQPLDGLIRSTNFFNGRLLTAEDLRQEQRAGRDGRAQLGRAYGDGVAHGFEVRKVAPPPAKPGEPPEPPAVVRVSAGLAVNRSGQALELAEETEVTLVREGEAADGGDAGLFGRCLPPETTTVVSGAGVYVLAVAPASEFRGRAPASGIGGRAATSPGCGSDYAVEGVRFKLARVDLRRVAESELQSQIGELARRKDAAGLSLLRNLVAYLCLDVWEWTERAADPLGFGTPDRKAAGAASESARAGTTATDALRASGGLTDCDVPLAVLCWTEEGIAFVDRWSVRRRPAVRAGLRSGDSAGDWRAREVEAMFAQFEEQVAEAGAALGGPAGERVADYFRYLPPAGVLPLSGGGTKTGFDPALLFGELRSGEIAMTDGDLLRPLFEEARAHAPIDLFAAAEVEEVERPAEARVQTYLVWENYLAVRQRRARQLALVFARRTLQYRGVARFGYDRWDLSRFARSVI